jgi:hypothetical protein
MPALRYLIRIHIITEIQMVCRQALAIGNRGLKLGLMELSLRLVYARMLHYRS